MSQPGPPLSSAARLLAFAIAATALLDALLTWYSRRVFAAAIDPATPWDRREALSGALDMLEHGSLLFTLLLAVLAVIAATRYARAASDRRVRNLALGTAACLAVDPLRELGLKLVTTFSGPAASGTTPADWVAYVQLWQLAGAVLTITALALMLGAAARQEHQARGSRPTWALATGALLATYTLLWLALRLSGVRRDPLGGLSIVDIAGWLGLAASFAVALGLLVHAARMQSSDLAASWTRAAAGLGRYKNATALRLLLAFTAGAFIMLARSGLDPLALMAILGSLGLIGIVTGLFQITGLVRVADVPAPRRALAVALPLFALGLAGECLALVPIFHFILSEGIRTVALRHSGLPTLTAATQLAGTITALTLLLAFRSLARARAAPDIARRSTTLIAVLLTILVALTAGYFLLENLALDSDTVQVVLLGGAATLLLTAIWLTVAYFRMLRRLQDAMARDPAA